MTTNAFKKFARSDDGAVTVDWVVMTAAVVGLGIAVLVSVSGGTTSLAANVSSALSDTDVGLGDGPFDVSKYIPLTGDSNFSSITDATANQTNDLQSKRGNTPPRDRHLRRPLRAPAIARRRRVGHDRPARACGDGRSRPELSRLKARLLTRASSVRDGAFSLCEDVGSVSQPCRSDPF